MFGGTHDEWDAGVQRSFYRYGPFQIISLLAAVFLCVVIVCALGVLLLYISDLAEEFPTFTRKVLVMITLMNIVVHTLILVVDQLSWWRSLISVAVNVCYYQVLRTFPFVRGAARMWALAAAVGLLVENAAWYYISMELVFFTPSWMVISFFAFLWVMPVALICCCSLEDDQLPTTGRFSSPGSATSRDVGGRSRSLFHTIVDLFK